MTGAFLHIHYCLQFPERIYLRFATRLSRARCHESGKDELPNRGLGLGSIELSKNTLFKPCENEHRPCLLFGREFNTPPRREREYDTITVQCTYTQHTYSDVICISPVLQRNYPHPHNLQQGYRAEKETRDASEQWRRLYHWSRNIYQDQ
jgi:hypothetical protein